MKIRTAGLAIAAIVVALFAIDVLAQDAGADAPRERRRPGAEGEQRGRFNPEEIRARMLEGIRTQIGATEDEWLILRPRVEKVQQLTQQIRLGAIRGMVARPDQPAAAGQREPSELEKAVQELRLILAEDRGATADEIKEKLTAVRIAREKARLELVLAQEELRELITARQEAQLMLMGLLD